MTSLASHTPHFTALGLEPTTDLATIKKAYTKRVLQYHPDKSGSQRSRAAFQAVQEAYETLRAYLLGNSDADLEDASASWKPRPHNAARPEGSHQETPRRSWAPPTFTPQEWRPPSFGDHCRHPYGQIARPPPHMHGFFTSHQKKQEAGINDGFKPSTYTRSKERQRPSHDYTAQPAQTQPPNASKQSAKGTGEAQEHRWTFAEPFFVVDDDEDDEVPEDPLESEDARKLRVTKREQELEVHNRWFSINEDIIRRWHTRVKQREDAYNGDAEVLKRDLKELQRQRDLETVANNRWRDESMIEILKEYMDGLEALNRS